MIRDLLMAAAGVFKAISLSLTGAYVTTSGGTSFTFTNVSFGDEAPNRKIVVGVITYATLGRTYSSVTIGGVTASLVIKLDGAGNPAATALYEADLPSGTSGDVTVTVSGSVQCFGISVYRMIDAGSVSGTYSDSTDPYQAAIDVPSGGAAIGFGRIVSTQTATWSGLDETVDQIVESGVTGMTSASKTFAAAQSGYAVQMTPSGSSANNRLLVASWGPQ